MSAAMSKRYPELLSYQDQLALIAGQKNVELRDAFDKAGVPSSTYYRSMFGPTNLGFKTAKKVHHALVRLKSK